MRNDLNKLANQLSHIKGIHKQKPTKPRVNTPAMVKLKVFRSLAGNKRKRGDAKSTDIRFPYYEDDLGQLTSPGATYTQNRFTLNPANVVTHPWFASIAAKFEQYKSDDYEIHVVSSSGESVGSTNTALGSYLINVCYDVADSTAFSTLQAIRDYGMTGHKRQCVESAPFRSSKFQVRELGKKGGTEDGFRYLNPSALVTPTYPTSTSAHDYDIGYAVVATQGQQATSVIGAIRVGWSGWLRARKVDLVGASSLTAHYAGLATTGNAVNALVQRSGSTMALTVSVNTITIPSVGRYMVYYQAQAATSYSGTALVVGANTTSVALLNASTQGSSIFGSATTSFASIIILDVTAANGVCSIGSPTIVGTCNADLFVMQIPSALTALAPDFQIDGRMAKVEQMLAKLLAQDASPPTTPSHIVAEDEVYVPSMTRSTSVLFSELQNRLARVVTK